MSTTGDRIRQARLAAGLTQEELASKIGVKYSAIHKYESGLVVNLKRTTIAALAKALDVKPSWLLCVDDDTVNYQNIIPLPIMNAESRELTDTKRKAIDLIMSIEDDAVLEIFIAAMEKAIKK